jgi:hypothetical protein
MASRPSRMDVRIRLSATLVILGLLIEGITIFWNSPGSFLAFAFLGVGFVALGVALFLLSLVTVKTDAEG